MSVDCEVQNCSINDLTVCTQCHHNRKSPWHIDCEVQNCSAKKIEICKGCSYNKNPLRHYLVAKKETFKITKTCIVNELVDTRIAI